jgi:hypothetical protein
VKRFLAARTRHAAKAGGGQTSTLKFSRYTTAAKNRVMALA